MKYWDADYYSIEENNDEKYIHIHGYYYMGENGVKVNEYTWFYLPVKEFNSPTFDYDSYQESLTQYVYDDIEEEQVDTWFGDNPIELGFEDIDESTPCGLYVNF